MIGTLTKLTGLTTLLVAGACAAVNPYASTTPLRTDHGIATTVEDCRSALNRATGEPVDKSDPGRIDLLNWNVKKGSMDGLQRDLRSISSGTELVILQEVDLDLDIARELEHVKHESFSQGYTTRAQTTGVATYSASAPLSECHLVSTEPLLRTPKATSITEYDLAGHEDNLLVVNVHAVNITWGLERYREQMKQIHDVVAAHKGPAILSGDFNTWRPARMEIVSNMVDRLAFRPVTLGADLRTRFNGLPLDHVFVRGLDVETSHSRPVSSSDHNPISVRFRL